MEQIFGGCAPVAHMATIQQSPAVSKADTSGPMSKSCPESASSAQARSPSRISFERNDDHSYDESVDEEDDKDYVPRQASRPKRRHSSRSDVVHCASKSTKRRYTSESPKLGSARSSTMVGEEEDSDKTPVVPTSINKSRRFTNVVYETVDASKAKYDSGGADPASVNTFPLGTQDGSALDLEEPI